MSFNKLTPAESERLALLAEEMGEAVQAIGKILRHGYESYNPTIPESETNRRMLERELGDVRGCMIMLCAVGDLNKNVIHTFADKKLESMKAGRWLHEQGESV